MWKPLLTGDEAASARAYVNRIAQRLESIVIDPASAALFWAYYSGLTEQPNHEALLAQSLERCLERLGQKPFPMWLHGGSLGAAWAVTHILDDATQIEELLGPYDAFLIEHLARPGAMQGDAGTISGLAGGLVYAIERHLAGDAAVAQRVATSVEYRLQASAKRTDQGWHWSVPENQLKIEDLQRFPNGLTFCGPGHGMSGIVATLAKAQALGLVSDPTMIEQGERWLAAQEALSPNLALFPHTVGPGAPPVLPKMLAWCSGTLATSLQRNYVATSLGLPTAGLISRLRACAEISPSSITVSDLSLCHGFIGHTLMFHWASATTGEAAFDAAAKQWFQPAQHAIAAAMANSPDLAIVVEHEVALHTNFLQGAAGAALGVMALCGNEAPPWLRMFGLFDDPTS